MDHFHLARQKGDIVPLRLPVQPVREGNGLFRHLIERLPEIRRQPLVPVQVDDERIGAGGIVRDGHEGLHFEQLVVPDIRWWIVLAVQHAGFQCAVDFGYRHFLRTRAQRPGGPDVYLLRRNAHFQSRQILGRPDRPNVVRVRTEALADARGRNMESVAPRARIDPVRQFAVDQPHRPVPVADQKRRHEQDEFRIGIGEQPATGALQHARCHHVHHFAFAAERCRKVVLDPDAAVRAPFQFVLEEHHRLAARRLGGLRVTVAEQITRFRRPAALRHRPAGRSRRSSIASRRSPDRFVGSPGLRTQHRRDADAQGTPADRRDESGCVVRAFGTFKAVQDALEFHQQRLRLACRSDRTTCPLSVPERRNRCRTPSTLKNINLL